MSDLRADLDRALRAVEPGAAPVDRALREGRRLRNRRRAAVLGGVLAVAAVAAGYPAAHLVTASAPQPATRGTQSPAPVISRAPVQNPVVTVAPGPSSQEPGGLRSRDGEIAEGRVGPRTWRAALTAGKPGTASAGEDCLRVTVSGAPDGGYQACGSLPVPGSDPVEFQAGSEGSEYETLVGAAAANVAYLLVTFTDGQQLKLIPLTWQGVRYVAWLAPQTMTIASVTAHLGGPYSGSGPSVTAVPFSLPGRLPVFELWLRPGQAAAPRATRVLASGTSSGQAWSVTAYEGPWGTCVLSSVLGDTSCVLGTRLDSTRVLGGLGGSGPVPVMFGSAAPGVAVVQVAFSDGTHASANAVPVGNEWLWAMPVVRGQAPAGWDARDSSGAVVESSSVSWPPVKA